MGSGVTSPLGSREQYPFLFYKRYRFFKLIVLGVSEKISPLKKQSLPERPKIFWSFRNVFQCSWAFNILGHHSDKSELSALGRIKTSKVFNSCYWFISTPLLSTLLYLHIEPINLVVSQEPKESWSWERLHAYMLSAFIRAERSYSAMPLVGQLIH